MGASCILYHGPGAREAAITEANRIGRLVAPPIGDGGLKVDDARLVVELLMSVPTGELTGVIVIGPMDEANAKSSDTLLKSIEDFRGDYTIPIMWAHDLGGVSLTIRSRCLDRFVSALGSNDNDVIVSDAFKIIEAVTTKDYLVVVDTMRPYDKREYDLIAALAEALSTRLDQEDCRQIWDRVRSVAEHRNPFLSELIVALIGS